MANRVDFPDFLKIGKELSSLIDELPNAAGVTAVNFFKDRFREKGWKDTGGLEKWDERAKEDRGSLLLRTGRLRRSIKKTTSKNLLIVSSDTPYSTIHNEGGVIKQTVTVKSHERKSKKGTKYQVQSHERNMNVKIPKRQFMGHSDYLLNDIEKQFMKQAELIQKRNL